MVKEKMTLQQYVMPFKNTNGGEDFPLDFLEQMYYSMTRHEIKASVAGFGGDINHVLWQDIFARSNSWGNDYVRVDDSSVDLYMFSQIWNSVLAACLVAFKKCSDVQSFHSLSDAS
jgi:brefeldin A-resistance guanine nucleotide exchange factor 1